MHLGMEKMIIDYLGVHGEQGTLFSILGMEPTDDFTKVKRAYRAAMLKYHPDKNQDNLKEAEERFKLVNVAKQELENLHDLGKLSNYKRWAESASISDATSNAIPIQPTMTTNTTSSSDFHQPTMTPGMSTANDTSLPNATWIWAFIPCQIWYHDRFEVDALGRLNLSEDDYLNATSMGIDAQDKLFETIANTMNKALKLGKTINIALDEEEAAELIGRDFTGGALAKMFLKIRIPLSMTSIPSGEKKAYASYGVAGGFGGLDGEYFSLKQGAAINPFDIMELTSAFHLDTVRRQLYKYARLDLNEDLCKQLGLTESRGQVSTSTIRAIGIAQASEYFIQNPNTNRPLTSQAMQNSILPISSGQPQPKAIMSSSSRPASDAIVSNVKPNDSAPQVGFWGFFSNIFSSSPSKPAAPRP